MMVLYWLRKIYNSISGFATELTLENVKTVVEDNLSHYQISDVDADASPYYYGFVDKIENWYILKQIGNTEASFRYCKGSGSYTTAWNNRASQTYNYFFTEF